MNIQMEMCQTNINSSPATKVHHKIHFFVHKILLDANNMSRHERKAIIFFPLKGIYRILNSVSVTLNFSIKMEKAHEYLC